MIEQSFDDLKVDHQDAIFLLSNNAPNLYYERIKFLSKTCSKLTINIVNFNDILMYGWQEFNLIVVRKTLQTGHYGNFNDMKIYVNKNVKRNHYIAE
jgi:hypothetical protein